MKNNSHELNGHSTAAMPVITSTEAGENPANRLPVKAKLVFVFSLLLVLLMTLGWLALNSIKRVNQNMDSLVKHHWAKVQLSREALVHSSANNRITLQVFLMTNEESIRSLLMERAQNTEEISNLVQKIEKDMESDQERNLLAAVKHTRTPYVESYKQALKLQIDDKKFDEARSVMIETTLPLLIRYHAAWEAFVQFQGEQMNQAARTAEANYASTRDEMFVLIFLAVISGAVIVIIVTRKIASEEVERRRAEHSLRKAHEELEIRIQHRTADLTKANQSLQAEISERKRAEDAFRESQSLYLSLVEQLPAGIFRKDSEGRYVFINSWFCRLKNLPAEQMLGKTPQELAAYELQNQGLDNSGKLPETKLAAQGTNDHELIMQAGKQIELEEQYTGPDGELQCLHVVKSPVFGPDGKVAGSQGILMDITQRKRMEAALDFERSLLRALMDKSDDRIYFKDTTSRFIRSSASMAEVFKLKNAEELAGKSDRDFFAGEHAQEAYDDEQKIIQTGEPVVGKMEKESWPDGRVTWALTSKMPLRSKTGEIIGTFGISKDITAIKEAEARLNEVHKQLVDASRQAGMAEVATSVLHNVGNVLNSVNVSSSLIADKMRNSKVANINKAVALIRANESDLNNFFANDPKGKQVPAYLSNLASHLAQEQQDILREVGSLASNILHIKEIVAMQQNYAKTSGVLESLPVVDLVEDAIRMNNGAMTRHQVKVVRDFAEVQPILTEKHKVLQILVNLIRNAKYACDDSGRDDKQITMRVANGNGRIKISVIDNGVGIPAENLTRIFNHGFTTRKEGHGFGLHSGAIAAKELGGSLLASSEGLGKGATFTLELPCQQQKTVTNIKTTFPK